MLYISPERMVEIFNYANFYKELVSNAMPYRGLLPFIARFTCCT